MSDILISSSPSRLLTAMAVFVSSILSPTIILFKNLSLKTPIRYFFAPAGLVNGPKILNIVL